MPRAISSRSRTVTNKAPSRRESPESDSRPGAVRVRPWLLVGARGQVEAGQHRPIGSAQCVRCAHSGMPRTRLTGPLILLILAAACSPSGVSGGAPYTIGAAGPWQLTHGRYTRLGIELALKEINDAGGVNGHKLLVKEADDKADGATAAQVAQKFVEDRTISAVVGHVTSGAMVAAAQV